MTTDNTKKVFFKRRGTTQKGDKYEDIFTARLALELAINDDVQAFLLSANDTNFGNFDDVVLEVSHKHQTTRKYAIQLKHLNNDKKTVTKDMLAAEKGNFSIEEYFQCFKKIKKKIPELEFLLYTNAKFDLTTIPCSFHLDKKKYLQITVNKVKLSASELLNTSENSYVFQFDMDKNDHSVKEGDDEIEEYRQFFKQFFFYPNQKNVEELEITLSKKFQDTYNCEENFFKMYEHFISNWSQVEGKKHYLEKHIVKFKIAEILLKPFISQTSEMPLDSSKYQSFKENCLQYDVVIFKTKEENALKQIRTLFSEQKYQIKKEDLEIANLFCIQELGKKDLNKIEYHTKKLILWHMDELPLTLHVTEENKTIIKQAIDLCLQENELKRKFILIGEDVELEKLNDAKIFRNVNDLTLDSTFLEELIENSQTTLQGREFTTFKALITNNEEMKQLITPVEIMKMLNGTLTIGEEREELPFPYIDQCLLSPQTSIDFLNQRSENVIPVISNIGIMDSHVKKYMNARFISIEDYIKNEDIKGNGNGMIEGNSNIYLAEQNLIIVTENECSKEQFQKICHKNPNKIYYHFSLKPNGIFKWIESNESIKTIRNTVKFVYSPKPDLFETIDHINIIASKPGMGKSTLMKYLKNYAPTDYWIVDINFREHTNFLKEKRDPLDIINYCLSFQAEKRQYNALTLEFRNIFEKEKKLMFLWDGFDEVPFFYCKQTLDNIENLVSLGYSNWITTRSNLQTMLEDKFNIFAMTIKNFDEEQQKNYIKKRLESKCSEKEINQIRDKITENIKTTGDVEFLGIPLHLSILTQLFSQNPEKYKKLLNSTFTLPDLIGCSIEETFNFCYKNKGSCDPEQPFLKMVFEEHMQWKMLQYELVALKSYLPDDVFHNLNNCEELLKYTKLTSDDFGLITKVDRDTQTVVFVHSIYGEYFVAKWISNNTELIPHIKDIFFSETFNNVRMIFDMLIAKDCPAHLAVLHRNIKTLRKYKNKCLQKDKMGRNPLHLACSWGERRPILTVEHKDDNHLIDDSNDDVIVNDDIPEQQEIINFLIKRKCDPFEKDIIFQWNCLEYADASLSLNSLEIMCRNGFEIELQKLKNFKCIYNVLYYSVKFDYKELFKAIGNVPYIEGKQNEENLLHMATFFDRNDYFDEIFKNQKYIEHINKRNCRKKMLYSKQLTPQDRWTPVLLELPQLPFPAAVSYKYTISSNMSICHQIFEQTPIHLAAINGNHDAIIKLIGKGADINIQNNYEQTPLHLAIIHNRFDVVKLLLRLGAKKNQINKSRENELHLAVKAGNLAVIKYLLKENIKIEANNGNMTPLHYAVLLNNTDIIDLIFDLKMHSKQKLLSLMRPLFNFALANGCMNVASHLITTNRVTTEDQISFLYFAINNNLYDAAKFLIENKINPNIRYKELTPFSTAALCGNINMLQLLLERGANINLTDKLGRTVLLNCLFGYIFKNCDDGNLNNENISIGVTINTIEFLLKNGADPNIPDNAGLTPLSCCLLCGNINISIESSGKEKWKIMKYDPSKPSTERINNQRLDFIKLLLDHGADGNAKDEEGKTLLHLSIIQNDTNVYEFLIINQQKYKVDVDMGDSNGETPLMYAVQKENIQLTNLLINSGVNINTNNISGGNSLQYSSENGNLHITKLLLNEGAHVNNKDQNDSTPLHQAACSGRLLDSSLQTWNEDVHEKYVNLAKLLIKNKANVNENNNLGSTPLHCAAFAGNVKMVELLIQEGCNPNETNIDGLSALSVSVCWDKKAVYEFLLNNKEKYSIDINHKEENGNNINLQLAIGRENIEAIKLLLASGVDVNDKNKKGATVLHLVSADGKSELAQVFLDLGATIDIRDNDGRTPLHYAASRGNREVVEILIKRGCIVDILDNFGDTPSQLAKDKGHRKIAKFIRSQISTTD